MGFADALIRVLRGVVGVVLWVLCCGCHAKPVVLDVQSSWLGIVGVVLTVLWLFWVKFEGHCVVGSVLWVAWGIVLLCDASCCSLFCAGVWSSGDNMSCVWCGTHSAQLTRERACL